MIARALYNQLALECTLNADIIIGRYDLEIMIYSLDPVGSRQKKTDRLKTSKVLEKTKKQISAVA